VTPAPQPYDENLWLEDIHGAQPLAWAREQTGASAAALDSPATRALQQRILEVLDSDDRIPVVTRRGELLYNYWRDSEHPRGLWRRTDLTSYRAPETAWEVLLDVDALGASEGVEWVFAGAQLLADGFDRALVRLSPDGGDAVVVREFDLPSRTFVADGFVIPTAKSRVSWVSRDEILVASDFGAGTLTSSSYPRQVRRLRRGQSITDAALLHEVPVEMVSVTGHHDPTEGFERDLVTESIDFYSSRTYLVTDSGLELIDVPLDSYSEVHREWLLVWARSDWAIGSDVVRTGELVAFRLEDFLAGGRRFSRVFTPSAHTALDDWSWTRNRLLLTTLDDVASRIVVVDPADWSYSALPGVPPLVVASVVSTDPHGSDEFWLSVSGFTTPPALLRGVLGGEEVAVVRQAPAFFDASAIDVSQHFATSEDGTRVPYFQVAPRELELDGSNRTLLDGYGGFGHSLLPTYSGVLGRAWLERGGVYVLANIRGGGEYGPAWHTGALRENRHRAYEDFAAIARDLVARGVTSPEHLAAEGRSNGGLLVGNMLVSYPELFGAIICGVPLLDMRRYTKLSAGASWIAEYGDPDVPEEWDFIRHFSPYHLLRDGVRYPAVFLYAATSDDRVGPVQARKMAARMQTRGIPDVLYYENEDGGHGGAVDNSATARLHSYMYGFAWERTGGGSAR
jgi:prolyl oligopeptidase